MSQKSLFGIKVGEYIELDLGMVKDSAVFEICNPPQVQFNSVSLRMNMRVTTHVLN